MEINTVSTILKVPLIIVVFTLFLFGCADGSMKVEQATKNACDFEFDDSFVSLERNQSFASVSIQGSFYEESGVFQLSHEQFAQLSERLQSNFRYLKSKQNNVETYLRDEVRIDRCIGSCELNNKSKTVAYRLFCE